MSGSGVPNDDMPNFLRPRRRDPSQLSDTALLSGAEPPADAVPGVQPVAEVLDALKAGPTSNELAGETAALAEFRRGVLAPMPVRRSRAGRLTSRLSARVAAAAAAAALGLGGFATAAFAGVLPAPVQRFAHETIGAPMPSAMRRESARGAHLTRGRGTAAITRFGVHTAYGLCTTYALASEHGTAGQRAAAFHNLARAAGGPDRIPGYCHAARPPGLRRGQHQPHPPGEGKGHRSGQGHGKRGDQSNGKSGDQSNGKGGDQGNGSGQGKGPGQGSGDGQGNGQGQGKGNGQGQGKGNGQGQGKGNGQGQGKGNGQGNDGHANGHHGNGHHGNAKGHSKGKAKGEARGHSHGGQSARRAGRGTGRPLSSGAQQNFTRHRTVTPRSQLGRVKPPRRSEGWRWQAVR